MAMFGRKRLQRVKVFANSKISIYHISLCLSGNILSPLKLFFPQLRTGSKLVPKCLMRSVHTRFLCFLAATPQKLYKNTVFRIFRKGTILSGRNIMSKHFLGLGQHRAAWGSTLKSQGSMSQHSKGLGQHGAIWGSPLKGWGSMGKHSKGLGQQKAVQGNTLQGWGSMGKHLKGLWQHGEAL